MLCPDVDKNPEHNNETSSCDQPQTHCLQTALVAQHASIDQVTRGARASRLLLCCGQEGLLLLSPLLMQ